LILAISPAVAYIRWHSRDVVGSSSNIVLNQDEPGATYPEKERKGYLYAAITALICPCHLPLIGIFLGTGAAGALFAQYFVLLAIITGVLTLISFIAAARILL